MEDPAQTYLNIPPYETNTKVELGYHIETHHGVRQKDYRGIVATKYPIGYPQ